MSIVDVDFHLHDGEVCYFLDLIRSRNGLKVIQTVFLFLTQKGFYSVFFMKGTVTLCEPSKGTESRCDDGS